MYKASQFAKKIGVSLKTVQRWDNSGKLKALRTPSGYRYYTEDDVRLAQGLKPLEQEQKTIVYCRVSSSGQKAELKNQVEAMKAYCSQTKIEPDEIVSEIGGGLNFKRKKFLNLIFSMLRGEINFIVVAHKDRLCRFAFDFIETLANANGCEILVANSESTSAQEELVEDLLAVVNCFSCRLYGLRSYTKEVRQNLINTLDNPRHKDVQS
jgi:predicted site-specific integrase-resolvase